MTDYQVSVALGGGITGFSGVYNVLDYGAAGNGTTDDTAAVQAAIDACSASGGGEVRFPAGTFLTTGINLDSMVGVTLRGVAQYGTTLSFNSTTGTWISLSASNMCHIIDFEIQSSGSQKTSGNNIWWLGASNCVLERVRMLSAYNGLVVDQSDQITIRKFLHRNQNVAWNINKVINIVQSAGTHVEDCNIGWGLATIDTSVIDINSGCDTTKFVNVEAVQVGGNTTNKPVLKIHHFYTGSSFAPRWLRFTNCAFESGTAGQGVLIEDANDVVFSGLYSVTNGTGIVIQGGRQIRFYGGIAGNNQFHGIDVQGGEDIIFNGFTSTGNSLDTTDTYSDFVISTGDAEYVKFIDCTAGADPDAVLNDTIAETSLYGFNINSAGAAKGHEIIRPVFDVGCTNNYNTTAEDIHGLTLTATADDATPSVSGVRILRLGDNTGATAITNLDGGVEGQIVTLVVTGSSNTPTIADSGNFNLSGAWGPGTGDTLTVVLVGSTWYEVANSDN